MGGVNLLKFCSSCGLPGLLNPCMPCRKADNPENKVVQAAVEGMQLLKQQPTKAQQAFCEYARKHDKMSPRASVRIQNAFACSGLSFDDFIQRIKDRKYIRHLGNQSIDELSKFTGINLPHKKAIYTEDQKREK